MITARNYAAQAEAALTHWGERMPSYEFKDHDVAACEILAWSIHHATHFAIPDGGSVFDDDLKGLAGLEPRLPFPSITVEYFVPESCATGPEDHLHSPRRLALATEMDRYSAQAINDQLIERLGYATRVRNPFDSFPDGNVLHICVVSDLYGAWVPCPMSLFIPSTWEDWPAPIKSTAPAHPWPKNHPKPIAAQPVPVLPGMFHRMIQRLGVTEAARVATNDVSGEARAVLELCEALTCSNVTTDILQAADPRINAKRERKGKLPLYETRTLSIEVPHLNHRGQYEIGDRRSPRQHLRRGHIRRLDDTRRIWVNSCVVGSPENGRIDKNYRVSS